MIILQTSRYTGFKDIRILRVKLCSYLLEISCKCVCLCSYSAVVQKHQTLQISNRLKRFTKKSLSKSNWSYHIRIATHYHWRESLQWKIMFLKLFAKTCMRQCQNIVTLKVVWFKWIIANYVNADESCCFCLLKAVTVRRCH